MNGDILVEQFFDCDPEFVWEALTDSASIASWLMPNDFKPVVGHRFQFRIPPQGNWDGIVNCEVLRVEEPKLLSYNWLGGVMSKPTLVTFTLTPVPHGTQLRLEHTGFAEADALMISEILGNGWKTKIISGSLPRAVEEISRRSAV